MNRGVGGLAQRLAMGLVALASLSVFVLAASVWVGHEWIEETVLTRSLARELDLLVESGLEPDDVNPRGRGLQYFRPALSAQWRVPAELKTLSAGTHHDVQIGDRSFHVLVRDLSGRDRAYLVSDIGDVERREQLILLALVASVLFTLLLSWLASGQIVRASLRPFSLLVERIRALDPERRGQSVRGDERYPDLEPIVEALNAQIAALDRVVERERAFAAAASHELRTPLAVIATAAELHAQNPHGSEAACARIQRSVVAATGLLDSLLLLSQARSLPEVEAVELERVLVESAEPYLDLARQRGLTLNWSVQPDARWRGSSAAAAIIFTNLLRNAIQAARAGRIEVEVGASEVAVRDFGPGLDPAIGAKAFEPGISTRTGGSGIGLYVARTLARRYAGDVRLDAPAGGGVRAVWQLGPTRGAG